MVRLIPNLRGVTQLVNRRKSGKNLIPAQLQEVLDSQAALRFETQKLMKAASAQILDLRQRLQEVLDSQAAHRSETQTLLQAASAQIKDQQQLQAHYRQNTQMIIRLKKLEQQLGVRQPPAPTPASECGQASDSCRGLDELKKKYPWPDQRPDAEPSDRGWDGGGREIITDIIATKPAKVLLEIGTFLGLSARTWLRASPELTVICLDPWFDLDVRERGLPEFTELYGKNLYQVFLSSNWEYKDRIIPFRSRSPQGLEEVHSFGVRPDVIFVDGDHSYELVLQDLETCQRLFPSAVLTGDDWFWDKNYHPPQSVREAVEDFAAAHDLRIRAEKNTWALSKTAG